MRAEVLLLTLFGVQCLAASRPNLGLFNQVLETVENAVDFFTEDYSSINVDGLFGLRLGQGQLREAIRECSLRSCNEAVVERLEGLERRLATASDAALPYVKEEDPAYYERFLATIDKPYILPYTPTVFEDQDGERGRVGTNRVYEEEHGDACYGRMLGTYKENGKLLPKCNITHDCWDYMTQDDTAAYFLTHQLLYFIMVEHVGCRETVENFIQDRSLTQVMDKFCGNIYNEANVISSKGTVRHHQRDLFLEQTVLCGPLGFEDFMRPDWLKMVLRWPDKRLGCFKTNIYDALLGIEEDNEKESQKQKGNTKNGGMRKLLREKPMKDGCLSHTSGLGFGVLNLYLRFLLRYL